MPFRPRIFERTFSTELYELLLHTRCGKAGKFSITEAGLLKLFANALELAKETRNFNGNRITSHDFCALCQGKRWNSEQRCWARNSVYERFHPVDKWPECYSEKMPTTAITYPWKDFDCLDYLPQFLKGVEERLGRNDERTYFFDVVFNDQNDPDITVEHRGEVFKGILFYLKVAELVYEGAKEHVAFMFNRAMMRAWCAAEAATRGRSIMRTRGIFEEDVGELILQGDTDCTVFIIVEGLTDLENDVWKCSDDAYDQLQAFDPNDLKSIRDQIDTSHGGKPGFDFLISVLVGSALSAYASLHSVRDPRRLLARAPRPTGTFFWLRIEYPSLSKICLSLRPDWTTESPRLAGGARKRCFIS